LFGVLTANSLEPSLDNASGRTCPLSNAMNEGAATAGVIVVASHNAPLASIQCSGRATPPERLNMSSLRSQVFSVVPCSGMTDARAGGTVRAE
jgi:hypothetical protein